MADKLAEAAVKEDKINRPRLIGVDCLLKIVKRKVLSINTKIDFINVFPENIKAIKILSRFHTNANALNDYLYKIKVFESNKCKICKRSKETLDHFMKVCPKYLNLRIPSVIEKTWVEIYEYILKTGRSF